VKHDTRKTYAAAVERAVESVRAGLDEAIDWTSLARQAALSPLHFHRIFRGMLGETVVELHRRLRLERAAFRLATTDAPVTHLAFEAGYETHESFTRAFRDAYATTPSEFRARGASARPSCSPTARIELASRAGIHFAEPMPERIDIVFTEETHAMHVEIETLPEKRVAAVAHRGPYNTISQAFNRLHELVRQADLFVPPVAAMVGIYYDDPETTPAFELRADAGLVVPSGVALPAGLSEVRLPAGSYAKFTHIGPYQKLGDAWARFMGEWLPHSGHRMRDGVSYERYWNTPANAKPEDLKTDLYILLAD
jgi:AraC family transcriptional regulator